MSRSQKPKFLLVMDWETSGTTWGTFEETFELYQGISFGAIIADATTFEPVETLYREIKFDAAKYAWSQEAENIHGKSREHLNEHGVKSKDAAIDLAELILKYFGGQAPVMFLGHNSQFDIYATKQLMEPYGVMPKLHHVVLDSSPLAFAVCGEYSSNKVFELFAGVEKRDLHNALEDAFACLAVLRTIRQIFEKGLSV
jgi:DNA polymerase III epsilon subunit-like protein